MTVYILRRVVAGFAVFITVTGICFLLYNLRGADAIALGILGTDSTIAEVKDKVVQLGLDRSLAAQYWDWLSGLFVGNLGTSFVSGQPVTSIMSTRVPVSLSLITVSMLLTIVFAVVLGVLAASRGGQIDRGVQGFSVVVGAVPGYWLALVLVIVFGLNLRLFPATGFVPIQSSFGGWLSTITLPAIAIALGPIFGLAVWIRSSIIDMRRQDWVRTLTSRGLSQSRIMYKHVLRNAAGPTVQILGLMVIGLIGGTIIVERIFALPGVGTMALVSGLAGDIPVVLGAVTFLVVVVVVINLAVDLVNGFLNPKARTR